MKRLQALFASVAATALVAALALTASGCARFDGPPRPLASACNRNGIAVTVFVTYDATTNKAETPNKLVYVCEDKDWVLWSASGGVVSDDFRWKTGSPFDEKPKYDKKVLKSKPPKKGTAGRGFDYDVDLVLDNGARIPIDPRIEIIQ